MHKQLNSTIDKSVNFVLENKQETRYVRRTKEYFIVYLSSHNGCNKACRFCHLTQTKQTEMNEASVDDILHQASLVLEYYTKRVIEHKEPPADKVHFNFMARGDALASRVILDKWSLISKGLAQLAINAGVKDFVFNISTIFPETTGHYFNNGSYSTLLLAFRKNPLYLPTIYYSLYSLEDSFRKRWLPKALDPYTVLADLHSWQEVTGGKVVLHWAFIEGQNDSEKTVKHICDSIEAFKLKAKFNVVCYNPYSLSQGKETTEDVIEQRFKQMLPFMKVSGSRIVPRVGLDVFASCGLFSNTN
jgi:23S rRNA (adenine2503-C2)-methyltransferase